MKKLNIEGKEFNFTDEQYEEIKKILRIAAKNYETLSDIYDDLAEKEAVYYTDTILGISTASKNKRFYLNNGGVFNVKALEQELARRHLHNIAFVLNGDWKPNWEDTNEEKYYIYYDNDDKEWSIGYDFEYNFCTPVFKSKELAEKALELMEKAGLLEDYKGE